jgi:Tfp pilus assembly protein PilX
VVALVILAVLTLLGVTGIKTTSLEEKMAANTQEGVRAFQFAEAGLSIAFADVDTIDELAGKAQVSTEVRRGGDAGTVVGQTLHQVRFNGFSKPPRTSLFSAAQFRAAYYDIESTGQPVAGGAETDITRTLHAGAYHIAPRP